MSAELKIEDQTKRDATQDMLLFMSEFSQLVDKHIATVRKILLATVDQAMTSVMAINDAADIKLKQADEVLVKGQQSEFISKSAKDIDISFRDPTAKVRHLNQSLSAHMANLSDLDESLRTFVFSMMGGLSIDDVVRQRLEHISVALHAMQDGVQKVILAYQSGVPVTDKFIESVQEEMLKIMFKAYTMEDEKKVYFKVFGSNK